MAVIEQGKSGPTRLRMLDVRGWMQRTPVDASWRNIPRQDVARIKSGRMGTDALRVWLRFNGPHINPDDEMIETVSQLCLPAVDKMRSIIKNEFQDYPTNTTASLILSEIKWAGIIVIYVKKILRERTMGENGEYYLRETESEIVDTYPCREVVPVPTRKEKLARAIHTWHR